MALALFPLDIISRTILKSIPNFPFIMMDFILMVFPTIGYWDQIRMMLVMNNPNIYTMNTALILISQGLIKVTFYFDEAFPLILLGQGVGLCVVSYVHTYFHYALSLTISSSELPHFGRETSTISQIFRSLKDNPKKAMNIYSAVSNSEFLTSVIFYYSIFFILYTIQKLIMGVHIAVNTWSVIASIIDSLLPLPVFTTVVIQRNIETTSIILVIQYFFGDIFKIFICYVNNSPWPFIFGSCLQLTLDCIMAIFFFILTMKKKLTKPAAEEAEPGSDN